MSQLLLLNRKKIRKYIRSLRRNLSIKQQEEAANLLAENANKFTIISNASRIALFLSIDGEINTYPLIKTLWKQKKQVYLPVIHPFMPDYLLFLRYIPETILTLNKFQILEPVFNITQIATLEQLDVILVPLVAFNHKCQRLGMGKGFYDRTLQNWQQYHFVPIGIAHDCQYFDTIPAASWDVNLPYIITPSKIWQN
ncbi:5-formyltetrahydrofolate cyclo-ligase [Pantoea sp. Aalb]|uniref:5-formyltetrahydrofolate cyclo-ligase n=1 Tax=Pantoea sp. Aalb TaxID=2576762 RepID=UPI001320D865|nr:5-formyltetrahydrofolate cyclo-ligase [Pantoea sp. Aalb]MXP67734.1 5-formyltetrahydrofolate cyclo-ligase [Pantoea sp. Aalb]